MLWEDYLSRRRLRAERQRIKIEDGLAGFKDCNKGGAFKLKTLEAYRKSYFKLFPPFLGVSSGFKGLIFNWTRLEAFGEDPESDGTSRGRISSNREVKVDYWALSVGLRIRCERREPSCGTMAIFPGVMGQGYLELLRILVCGQVTEALSVGKCTHA